jgi:hypothetical protein
MAPCGIVCLMCRNIRVLHNFRPPTTEDEIHAAALQYVRKVSGSTNPSLADREAFERAVQDVSRATTKLLASLTPRTPQRTREAESARAKERWRVRAMRLKQV